MAVTELFSLTGRVALVTGASRGLGWAIAELLAEAGAHIVLNGREPETLEPRLETLQRAGHRASLAPFDVADEGAARVAVAEIVARQGRLDILVSNAGTFHVAPLGGFATAEWQRVIDVNLTAGFVLAREAAGPMAAQGWGRIVTISSILARTIKPALFPYTASKAGLEGLTRALAVELGPKGVTCNAIAPGYFPTEMNRDVLDDPTAYEAMRARTPTGRWGENREIAAAVLFLVSDAASYVNGHVLMVDGGLTAAL